MKVDARYLVVDTLCKLYALGMMMIGFMVPITNLVTQGGHAEEVNLKADVLQGTKTFMQIFHILQSGLGIVFFVFMQVFVVRGMTVFDETELKPDNEQEEGNPWWLSRSNSTFSIDTSFTKLNGEEVGQNGTDAGSSASLHRANGRELKRLPVCNNYKTSSDRMDVVELEVTSLEALHDGRRERQRFESLRSLDGIRSARCPGATNLRHGEASYPNFYVRVGAVLFGVGTLVTSGIAVSKILEEWLQCQITVHPMEIGFYVLLAIFTSFQLHFIFKYCKISINRFTVLCRFGMMHLVATNINVWVHVVMSELEPSQGHTTIPTHGQADNKSTENNCSQSVPGTYLMTTSKHYLYPLIVEFSLIGAVCFYNIYENIGLMHKIREKRRKSRAKSIASTAVLHFPHHLAVNATCHKSSKGAFLGVMALALSIVSCIIYNVHEYVNDSNVTTAILTFTQIGILFPSCLAVSFAIYSTRKLSFLPNYQKGPDETLLMIAIVGIYAHSIFSAFDLHVFSSVADLWMTISRSLSSSLSIAQSTLQVMFIYDGLRRQTSTTKILRRKPGREAVVLLLLLNLALWTVNSFDTNIGHISGPKDINDLILLTKLTKPLIIFFRFHSSTCLYEIWKNSYRLHKTFDD